MSTTTDAPSKLKVETVKLGSLTVPRVFIGLWQLSSPAWGYSTIPKIRRDMRKLIDAGYTAFDMADHYGPAEQLFGEVRKSLRDPSSVTGATKWCIFRPPENATGLYEKRDVVAGVKERNDRMLSDHVDLLQFHWNSYYDTQYINVIRFLKDLRYDVKDGPSETKLIREIGLVNFDAVRLEQICTELPAAVVSNQVQFSLIDTRPLREMAQICRKHGVKLLTYGTLCGGFLSDKHLNAAPPHEYEDKLNPSERKYFDIISNVWGDWNLFQELLTTLRRIGDRHNYRSIANVATRWVLDHDFVGAVIVGARLGISDHANDNDRIYGFTLTAEDKAEIQSVLQKSNTDRMIQILGDCGGEYRA